MIIPVINGGTRPNRVTTPETGKDENYHLQYGRYVANACYHSKHRDMVNNYTVNRKFYKNDQWGLQEDHDTFFMDDTGETNNRIKVTRNFIQPMVEQYRGNAERMMFNSQVFSMSPFVKSQRDVMLNKLQLYSYVGKLNPDFRSYIQKEFPNVGNTEQETYATFENTYVDKYVRSLNNLLRNVRETNQLASYRKIIAQDLALAGIGIMRPYIQGGQYCFRRVAPDNFGWDIDAHMYDMKDSQFFYEQHFYALSDLVEMADIPLDVITALEKNINSATQRIAGSLYSLGNRIPVGEAVWKDVVVDWFGYVYDKFGQIVLRRLDDPNVLEDERYSSDDLVPYERLNEFQKKVVKSNGKVSKVRRVCDIWRYCKFVPSEYVNISARTGDLVIEYGVLPYQETDLYNPNNTVPPFKVGIWLFDDGDIISPVSVAINPQRMINRFLSIMENHLNNSGGAGPVIDRDMIEGGSDEEVEVIRNVKRGKPVFLSTRGLGVQNAIGQYNAALKENTVVLANLIENYKRGMESVTAINENMMGGTSPDQLVGVMQLSLQRGSVIQQPFYSALQTIFQGCDQAIVTSAKRLYIDNDTELVNIVGYDNVEAFKLSKDIRNETFRVYLKVGLDPDMERREVDQQLLTYLQLGLLDDQRVSNMIGRASSDDVYAAIREYAKERREMQRISATQQQNAAAVQEQKQNQLLSAVAQQDAAEKEFLASEAQKDRDASIANTLIKKS